MDGTCSLDLRLAPDDFKVHTFLAQDLLESTTVRINDEGSVVSTNGLSRKEQGKLGHSVQLKFKSAPEEGSRFKVQHTTAVSSVNLGKRPARSMNTKINGFIDKKSFNEVMQVYGVCLWSSLFLTLSALLLSPCAMHRVSPSLQALA